VNILIVCAQFPYPPRSGFAMRVNHLTRQLARRHNVTLLSYAWEHEEEGVAAVSEEISVRAVRREPMSVREKRTAQAVSMLSSRPYYCREVYSEAMQRAINELCADGAFDFVQLESSFLCAFEFPPGTRLVIDEHNIESEVFRRMCEGERSIPRRLFNRVEHGRFQRFEQDHWKRAAGCIVTSDRELPVFSARAPHTPVTVVPNGVDLDYFSPSNAPVEPDTVIFNGILTYRPNVDAALYLVDEVWPRVTSQRPAARLSIVGRSPAEEVERLRRPGVEVTGEVPDIRPHLAKAAVVAAPVRIGGGTRLKIVEGLAMGKAMVSTSLGCEGIPVSDRAQLMIADEPEAFAARIVELFDRPDLGAELGRAGRELVEREYSWELAGERLAALYERIGVELATGVGEYRPWQYLVGSDA
jgi:polysaccharide biosynthesis protein PslH